MVVYWTDRANYVPIFGSNKEHSSDSSSIQDSVVDTGSRCTVMPSINELEEQEEVDEEQQQLRTKLTTSMSSLVGRDKSAFSRAYRGIPRSTLSDSMPR